MSAARWDRLSADLAAAGVVVTVATRAYPGGMSRSVAVKRPGGDLVEIHDKWWNRNPSKWVGWQVHVENGDGILTRSYAITRSRREVVQAFVENLSIQD